MAAVFVALAKASSNKRWQSAYQARALSLSLDRMRAGCWLIKESREKEEAEEQKKWSIAADNAQLLVLGA